MFFTQVFSHCTSSFPEVYVFIFCFLFFLVTFFGVTLFSLGGGGILENLIIMVAWCYILKSMIVRVIRGVTGWVPQFL